MLPDNPPGIRAKVDAIVNDLADAASAFQSVKLAARGRYWQGLSSHAAPPADGAASAPDRARAAQGETENWSDAGLPLPPLMECAARIDVYDGPSGRGYVIAGELLLAGVRYLRRIHTGPEAWREHDWVPVAVRLEE